MKKEFTIPSCGQGQLHCCLWLPEGEIRAILQIVHGIAEHILRYEEFALWLNTHGIAVAAEDHMGHGKTAPDKDSLGYFTGGWFAAVQDTCALLHTVQEQYPDVPYILLGHSMGSFMTRTLLCKYPTVHLAGVIISGTGWQPEGLLNAAIPLCNTICKLCGEKNPNGLVTSLVFGGNNKRVEHKRTENDWLTRDAAAVDAYNADPMCGFPASVGLIRDMLGGIRYIQQPENLQKMNKELPVFFLSGGDDPVGAYGAGVHKAADAFLSAGMRHVTRKLYPLGRHEMLNEINRTEVYQDILNWVNALLAK